jgi:hypothetical protein
MIQLSINLSKIPKEKIFTSKSGEKWINLLVGEKKEVGKYGETHFIAVSKSKEEREANVESVYVGNGKEIKPNNQNASSSQNSTSQGDDDLPF